MNPEDKVISYGDDGNYFYLIANGHVEIQLPDKKNDPIFLKHGDYFGECALLYDCKRSATVVTTNYCTFSRIEKEPFKEFIKDFS